MYEMICVVISGLTFCVGVVCLILESMALIKASLEELPVSAVLGQRCLATMIRAPEPSYFGWFRHSGDIKKCQHTCSSKHMTNITFSLELYTWIFVCLCSH